jgi:DNA polymerase III alpha subunit
VTDEEKTRVDMEMELYKKFNLHVVLKYLVYLVDQMRQHNIVWGVGRGSSVSSYVLFLIGIHKVDSIKYNLDINEFLR